MSRVDLVNAGALVLVLGTATAGALVAGDKARPQAAPVESSVPSDASDEVSDARGHAVRARAFERIVSVNSVADHLLLQLVEPERLVGISSYTADAHPEAWRFGARPGVAGAKQLEAILALRPDLVVLSKFSDEAFVQRLDEAGVEVFDLGEMRGVVTTLDNIETLGRLLEVSERAEQLAGRWQRQIERLRAGVPEDRRVSGIYLSLMGDRMYGGSEGSSYADVMRLAGIDDLAARHGYREWPSYSIEQLLEMNPPVVVTQQDMGPAMCAHSALSQLAACQPGGRILEVPAGYESDPGLGLVEAAAAVQAQLLQESSTTGP